MTLPLPAKLADDALALRPWLPADINAVYRACQDPQIQRWTTVPVPYLKEHAEQYVLDSAQRWTAGAASFAAIDPATGAVVGSIGFTEPLSDNVAEIGYWVAPWARCRGVATSAVRLVCRWGFESAGLARIQWQAEVGNVASRLVVEACGFTIEGRLRRGLAGREGNVDGWIGSLLPGEPMEPNRPRLVPAEPVVVWGGDPPIALRAPRQSDAEWVLEAYLDPEVAQWNPSQVTDPASAHEWIRQRAYWADGAHASWLVIDPRTDSPIGSVSLHKINAENLTASIGYWTHPAHRGRGYATSAVRLASELALGRLGLKRVELIHAIENPTSCRVAEGAGFEREGSLQQAQRYGDGKWYDEHIHARCRTGERTALLSGS